MIWTVREAFVAGFGLFTSMSIEGSPNGKLCWRKRDDFVRAARKCHGDWVTFRPSRLKEALVCGPLVVTLRSEPLTPRRIVTFSNGEKCDSAGSTSSDGGERVPEPWQDIHGK